MALDNVLNIYWKGNLDLSTIDIWAWWDGKCGSGYKLKKCTYGGYVSINVPVFIKRVGFIVRTNCSNPGESFWGEARKDFPNDRYIMISGPETSVYLKSGIGAQYYSTNGGSTLREIKAFTLASICSSNQIKYYISPPATLRSLGDIRVLDGETDVRVDNVSSLNSCASYGIITTREKLNLHTVYTVSIRDYGKINAIPLEIFNTAEFSNAFNYKGDDLGVCLVDGVSYFKLWAPTAVSVFLNIYTQGEGGELLKSLKMEMLDKGVWTLSTEYGHGFYYTYTVKTSLGECETGDPYAKACGINGKRSMIVDLSKTNPEGFENDEFVKCDDYRDAVIWETHVKDFSVDIRDCVNKGKFLAFTESGLVNSNGIPCGIDWLKEMGITHVQLQPVFDYASVDETDPLQYNWGYDPQNYNIPEGSYSTDAYNGEVRIYEFKRMVQSLHQAGIGVIMDVVYNHTYNLDSVLNRTVPFYYYRYTSLGVPSNGSGCGNETASERAMFRKYILNSLRYWMTEYHVDGFRFDLMGIHDIVTMQEVEELVHSINPCALIYGEGWSGGAVALRFTEQAVQSNISRISFTGIGGIAVFNDVIRDGLKGNVFNSRSKGYINGNANTYNTNKVIFGIQGGTSTTGVNWTVKKSLIVNYMSAHDNYTLWDQLRLSNSGSDIESTLKMNKLGASIIFLSSGMPFMLGGEEMLRSKNFDDNSYKSPISVNSIKWKMLKEESEQYKMALFYKKLIEMRKKNEFIRRSDVICMVKENNVIKVTYKDNGVVLGCAFINPSELEFKFSIENDIMEVIFSSDKYNIFKNTIIINPKSVIILKKMG